MGPSRVLIRRVIVLLGLVLEASFVGAAADDRPTVALVLGGGSARGLAHVGVLEWLEDHRIPVDIVVGTSMGGLVGGAYATGRSPAEIKAILGSANWDLLFLGDVQFPLKTFRRKEDRRSYPFVELGLRGGLSLPSGLDPGHQIGLFLSRLALDQSPITDFDDLPIPFRCVAVDIERGEQVVLGSGSLGHSLRATMSIPGVFAPIEIDGRLLADGGLLSNVPTSVAKDLGADVVIAVSVGAGLVDRDALGSPLALIGQSLTVMMLENTRRELELADIVIEPELDGVGSTAWRQFEQIARRGYDAAAQRGEALSAFALNDAAWAAHLARRQARGLSNPFRPTTVTVDGLDPLEREAMQVALQDHVDRPLDPGRLEEQLTVIAGAGRYESLRYGVRRDRGTDDLRIDVTPKAHGPPFVNLGIDIGDLEGDIDFNFGARITAYDVLVPRAETRLDLAIGSRNGARAEYYLPLGDTRWFVAPSTSHEKRTQNFFRDGDLIATYGTRRSAGGSDLGFTLGPSSEVRADYQVTYLDSSVTIGDPFLPEVSGREQIARIRWVYDGADRWIVPQRGVRMSSVVRAILDPADGAAGFPQAEAEVTIFRPIGSGDRVAATLRGGTSFDNDPSAFYEFTLGGPLRLGAFDVDEFRGNHFLYSSFWYLRTIGRLPDILGGSIFLAGWAEAGSAFERLRAARFKSNLSTGVVIETFVGPVTFAGSVGDDGSSAFYFSIGGLLAR